MSGSASRRAGRPPAAISLARACTPGGANGLLIALAPSNTQTLWSSTASRGPSPTASRPRFTVTVASAACERERSVSFAS